MIPDILIYRTKCRNGNKNQLGTWVDYNTMLIHIVDTINTKKGRGK